MSRRIIQLSDLHLTARIGDRTRGSDVWGNLDAVLRQLHAQAVDLLVLSGDLANQRRLATYVQLRQRLQPFEGRLRVLPGNHDSRRLLRRVFGDVLVPDLASANFVVELGGCRILGLDSVRRPFVHGKFGAPQLQWLAGELQRTRLPLLLFSHHPLLPIGCWWLDKDLPRDRRELLALLRDRPVRAVSCGHVHQETAGDADGVPVWTTPAVAYQFEPRCRVPARVVSRGAGYRCIDVDGGEVSTQVVRLPESAA